MAELVQVHTGQLDRSQLAGVRALLEEAFDGDLSPDDWEHCLGGMHVLIREDGGLVAHGALVRRLVIRAFAGAAAGRALPWRVRGVLPKHRPGHYGCPTTASGGRPLVG